MSLFGEEIAEVEYQDCRYIIRRNPKRAKEIQENRKSRIEYIIKKSSKRTTIWPNTRKRPKKWP